MPLVLGLLGLPAGEEGDPHALCSGAQKLLEEFPTLRMVAVTRGACGSLLVARDGWHAHPGVETKVADTIGAGDAFTAALTHYLLRGADLETLNEAGNRWGAWMASQQGAMPPLSEAVRSRLKDSIEARLV
jgi:fructokinase